MQDLHPTHQEVSVITAPVSGTRFLASVGQIFMHGASLQCWHTMGINVAISGHFFTRIREKAEQEAPSWDRLQTISQERHPVQLSGRIETQFIVHSYLCTSY
jgi:hypothetical protein